MAIKLENSEEDYLYNEALTISKYLNNTSQAADEKQISSAAPKKVFQVYDHGSHKNYYFMAMELLGPFWEMKS